MKRKSPDAKAVEIFLKHMQTLAKEWSNADATISLEDAMHLWAAGEIAEFVSKCTDDLRGEEPCRKLRKWLRNEPTRILKLIDAARQTLTATPPAN